MFGRKSSARHRLRVMDALILQVKADHKMIKDALNQVRKKGIQGTIDQEEQERLMRALSDLRQGVGQIKKFGKGQIETVSFPELSDIEEDIKEIEGVLIAILYGSDIGCGKMVKEDEEGAS